jgi:hypothetical protein
MPSVLSTQTSVKSARAALNNHAQIQHPVQARLALLEEQNSRQRDLGRPPLNTEEIRVLKATLSPLLDREEELQRAYAAAIGLRIDQLQFSIKRKLASRASSARQMRTLLAGVRRRVGKTPFEVDPTSQVYYQIKIVN